MVVVNSKSPGCHPRGSNSEEIQIHARLVEHGISGIMNQWQNIGFPIFLCESPAREKDTCCEAQPADFYVSFYHCPLGITRMQVLCADCLQPGQDSCFGCTACLVGRTCQAGMAGSDKSTEYDLSASAFPESSVPCRRASSISCQNRGRYSREGKD